MKRIAVPGGWHIRPDDENAVETEWWLYNDQNTGVMIVAFDIEGAEQFAAVLNAPRPAEAELVAKVERLREALSFYQSVWAHPADFALDYLKKDRGAVANSALAHPKQEGGE